MVGREGYAKPQSGGLVMPNILVAAVGMTPQVVTETLIKLQGDHVDIDEIVVFYTTDDRVKQGVQHLEKELKNKTKATLIQIPLEFDEVNGPEQDRQFMRIVFSELWKRRLHDESLYVSIAGGRKTMSALLYWIAEIVGARNITHILTSTEVEQSKEFFPPLEKLTLIKLDFLDFFPVVIHLCKVNEINTNNSDKVWKIVKLLPTLLPGLMQKVISEVYPSDEDEIDFQSDKIKEIKTRLLKQIHSEPSAHILLFGETGVGKEYIAKFINKNTTGDSNRKRPFITINCATITPQIAGSELFGHKKGSFTGATDNKIGQIELARDGDLFLDEIGELPLEVQAKLLRFFQFGEYTPVGDTAKKSIVVRVIAATNREPKDLRVRKDLLGRFKFIYTIPPIRERPDDIKQFTIEILKKSKKTITKEAMDLLLDYNWPNNFRELASVLSNAPLLEADTNDQISADAIKKAIEDTKLYQINTYQEDINEKTKIETVLKKYAGKKGKVKLAAKELETAPSTLYNKIKEYKIIV